MTIYLRFESEDQAKEVLSDYIGRGVARPSYITTPA